MKNTYLAICAIALAITITTSAMGAERVLTCFYDNPRLKDRSINVLVDEEKSKVIYNYQNTEGHVEEELKIADGYNEWIYANNSITKFIINKNNGRWGYSWAAGGVDGVPQGGFVKGICHAKPFK